MDGTTDWTGGKHFPPRGFVNIGQADGLEPGTTYNFRYRVSNEDRDSFFEAGETADDHRSDVRVHRRRERERGRRR